MTLSSAPVVGSPEWFSVYVPAVVRMAETKLSLVRGAARRRLTDLIAAAVAADAAQMSLQPDSECPRFMAALEAACSAGWALNSFANPL